MKKLTSNWKHQVGIIEPSKGEIEYFEAYEGKELTFEQIVAKSKRKQPKNAIYSNV